MDSHKHAVTGAFGDLSARYVAELRKPRFTFGRLIGLIVALGAGFVLGTVVHE